MLKLLDRDRNGVCVEGRAVTISTKTNKFHVLGLRRYPDKVEQLIECAAGPGARAGLSRRIGARSGLGKSAFREKILKTLNRKLLGPAHQAGNGQTESGRAMLRTRVAKRAGTGFHTLFLLVRLYPTAPLGQFKKQKPPSVYQPSGRT